MKHWRLKRLIPAGDKLGTGEWEVSPWWSSFLPFIYKSKSYYFSHTLKELPITPYRYRPQSGRDVISRSMTAEYWNGWLPTLWRITSAKIKAIRKTKTEQEDIPF